MSVVRDRLDRRYLRLLIAIGVFSYVALVLGEFGWLRGMALLLPALAAATVAYAVGRRPAEPASGAAASAPEVAALLLLCAALFLPPHQAVVQGADATVYANWGRKTAEAGGLTFDDPFVAAMPAASRAEWFDNRSQFRRTGRLHRFPGGFQIASASDPTVTASFAPMFPIVAALFHRLGVGGLGSLYVAPAFGALSVVALFLVGTHLGGRRSGWLTVALTLAAMPQIWFARLPLPELIAQCFVMAGVLAWLVALRDAQVRYALAAGFFFGLAGFAKADLNVLLPVAFAAFGAWCCLGNAPVRSLLAWLLASFAPLVVHNVAHYFIVPSDYVASVENIARLSGFESITMTHAVGGLAVLSVLAVMAWRSSARVRRLAAGVALTAGTAAYFYVYFTTFRMRLDETLVPLSWYLSWPVLLAAAGGMVWLIGSGRARRHPGVGLVLALLLVFGATYLYSPLESAVHVFSMRRYIPVILPLLMLVAALGINAAVNLTAPWYRVWVTASASIILVSLVARPSVAVVGGSFWTGAVAQTAGVARTFPPGSVLLMSPDLAGTHVPTTLAYLHDVDTVLVQDRHPRAELVQAAVSDWLRVGRQVFFVFSNRGRFSTFAPTLHLGEARESLIEVPMLERTRGRLPQAAVVQSVRLLAYPVTPRVAPAEVVEVGEAADDALYDLRGFHAAESTPEGTTFRWTGPVASLRVPAGDEITLTLDGGRPEGVPPAEVGIRLDGLEVLRTLLEGGTEDVSVTVPRPAAASVEVGIEATVFNPAALGLTPPDPRDLGVRVHRVAFSQGPVNDGARQDGPAAQPE